MSTVVETHTETPAQNSTRLILRRRQQQRTSIEKIADERQRQKLKLDLIKQEIEDFKAFDAAARGLDGAATLTLIRLREQVKNLGSKFYALKDLYKDMGISASKAQKRVKAFKREAKESKMTPEQLIKKWEEDIQKGVKIFGKKKLKLQQTAKFIMDPAIKTALEHDIEVAEEKRVEKAEKEELVKQRADDLQNETILDLEISIQLLKKRLLEKNDEKGYALADAVGKLSLKLIEQMKSGHAFDVTTPTSADYKSKMKSSFNFESSGDEATDATGGNGVTSNSDFDIVDEDDKPNEVDDVADKMDSMNMNAAQ